MDIYNFLRNSKAFNIFKTDIKNNTLGHAYIIYSRDSFAAQKMLELYACALLCLSPLKPCMKCRNCIRILNGSHPDCIKYPLKGDKLYVEDIDSLIADINYRPCEGSIKIYCLDKCETMNHQSQNKLLKTLEEPVSFAHIFMGTASLENLLPTVKSRAKIIEIEQFLQESVFNFLSAVYGDSEKSRFAASACGGLIGKAIKMTEDGEYLRLYGTVYTLLDRIKNYDDILSVTEELNSYKDKNEILDIMQLYFRDCLMCKTGLNSLVFNKNSLNGIKGAAVHYKESSLVSLIESVNEAKKKLRLNCNAGAVFETLLIRAAEMRENGGKQH